MTQPPGSTSTQKRLNGANSTLHIPGEAGMWVFIFGDMVVFAILFATFLYYRGDQPEIFRRGELELHRSFGAVNTLLLLTSSLSVASAVRAVRGHLARIAPLALGLALLCGAAFLVNKGLEWSSLIGDGHKPASNDYFMWFFVLTGIHAFHLLLGMAALITLLVLSRKPGLTAGQFAFFEGGACFWHMVDLLWIVLFALLYLIH